MKDSLKHDRLKKNILLNNLEKIEKAAVDALFFLSRVKKLSHEKREFIQMLVEFLEHDIVV